MSSGIWKTVKFQVRVLLIKIAKLFRVNTLLLSSETSTTSSTEDESFKGRMTVYDPEGQANQGDLTLVNEEDVIPPSSNREFSKVLGISITQNGNKYRVVIDGHIYQGTGTDIQIRNNVLYVDGKPHEDVKPLDGQNTIKLEIEVIGNLGNLVTQGNVTVQGSVHGKIETQGVVAVNGDVHSSVTTQDRVECGSIRGSLSTQGKVNCGNVGGNVNTMGKVEVQGGVQGDINTMGKVIVHNKGQGRTQDHDNQMSIDGDGNIQIAGNMWTSVVKKYT